MTRGMLRALVAAALGGLTVIAAAQTEPPEMAGVAAQTEAAAEGAAQTEQAAMAEDAALRIGLDSTPDEMLVDLFPELQEQYPEFAGAVQQVNPTNVQWTANVVTVAFHGGSTEVRELIESAAAEWTAHSRTFRFSFRDAQRRFRQWRPNDEIAAADIRIGFATTRSDGRPDGYWSRLGLLATDRDFSPLRRPTMNFAGFDTKLQPYAGAENRNAWLGSYLHSVVLHEFGHALALAHEHFHPDCQRDLKLEDDADYLPGQDARRAYIADAAGRQPGALRVFQGFPNFWSPTNARFNLSATAYFEATRQNIATELNAPSSIQQSTAIDRRSVMMYALDPALLASGAHSMCIGTGDGRFRDGARFANRLSEGDIAYFRRYYDRL